MVVKLFFPACWSFLFILQILVQKFMLEPFFISWPTLGTLLSEHGSHKLVTSLKFTPLDFECYISNTLNFIGLRMSNDHLHIINFNKIWKEFFFKVMFSRTAIQNHVSPMFPLEAINDVSWMFSISLSWTTPVSFLFSSCLYQHPSVRKIKTTIFPLFKGC